MLRRILRFLNTIADAAMHATLLVMSLLTAALSFLAGSLVVVCWLAGSPEGVTIYLYALVVFVLLFLLQASKRFRAHAIESTGHLPVFVASVVVCTGIGMPLAGVMLLTGETTLPFSVMFSCSVIGPVLAFLIAYLMGEYYDGDADWD